MTRSVCILLLGLALGALLGGAEEGDIVFRSDVALLRVDAQVVDRSNRAIAGLSAEDFVLREGGRPRDIRNFAREEMPVDVLLLLDVSGSMRPHVERIASAAHQALRVLGEDDRVAIMVFDRSTRLRLPFRNSREDVQRELDALLRDETFDGGTDITRGLLDASKYLTREARREARRAIVILTDDRTERGRDEAGVLRALAGADSVLSALLAPDAMWNRSGGSSRGGSWPGGGIGGPLGDIILGRRGGGRGPGPVVIGSNTQSAGTAEIARQSGGDSLQVDEASALETTLSRIRQRYALHFYLPEDVKPGQEMSIDVALSDAARRRYPEAEVRFRRVYLAPGGTVDAASPSAEPAVTARGPAARTRSDAPSEGPNLRRRPAVNEPGGPRTANPAVGAGGQASDAAAGSPASGGWRRADEPAREPAASDAAPAEQAPSEGGGWRRVEPGQQP